MARRNTGIEDHGRHSYGAERITFQETSETPAGFTEAMELYRKAVARKVLRHPELKGLRLYDQASWETVDLRESDGWSDGWMLRGETFNAPNMTALVSEEGWESGNFLLTIMEAAPKWSTPLKGRSTKKALKEAGSIIEGFLAAGTWPDGLGRHRVYRRRRNAGHVASKIRAHTARKNRR